MGTLWCYSWYYWYTNSNGEINMKRQCHYTTKITICPRDRNISCTGCKIPEKENKISEYLEKYKEFYIRYLKDFSPDKVLSEMENWTDGIYKSKDKELIKIAFKKFIDFMKKNYLITLNVDHIKNKILGDDMVKKKEEIKTEPERILIAQAATGYVLIQLINEMTMSKKSIDFSLEKVIKNSIKYGKDVDVTKKKLMIC